MNERELKAFNQRLRTPRGWRAKRTAAPAAPVGPNGVPLDRANATSTLSGIIGFDIAAAAKAKREAAKTSG
jgi:hypothetical protein